MRLRALYLTGALIATAIPFAAQAQSAPPYYEPATGVEQTAPAPDVCRPGWVWEPAGYVSLGRWQTGRCVPREMLESGEGVY